METPDLFGGTSQNKGKKVSVIPFGKYKGQPIEVLQSDPDYAEWLQGQDWFRSRYQNIYNVVINNFGEPDETPEHNALQALFLDEEFRGKFLKWTGRWPRFKIHSIDCVFEEKGIDVTLHPWIWKMTSEDVSIEKNDSWSDVLSRLGVLPKINKYSKGGGDYAIEEPYMWVREILFYDWQPADTHGKITIEIKPVLGDDYPAILRNMKSSGVDYLMISDYSGVGATLDQVRSIFEMSDRYLCTLSEINAIGETEIRKEEPHDIKDSYYAIEKSELHESLFTGGPLDGSRYSFDYYDLEITKGEQKGKYEREPEGGGIMKWKTIETLLEEAHDDRRRSIIMERYNMKTGSYQGLFGTPALRKIEGTQKADE